LQYGSHYLGQGSIAHSCSCSGPRSGTVLVIVIGNHFGMFSKSQSGLHDHDYEHEHDYEN
jgi:hypothetical protein